MEGNKQQALAWDILPDEVRGELLEEYEPGYHGPYESGFTRALELAFGKENLGFEANRKKPAALVDKDEMDRLADACTEDFYIGREVRTLGDDARRRETSCHFRHFGRYLREDYLVVRKDSVAEIYESLKKRVSDGKADPGTQSWVVGRMTLLEELFGKDTLSKAGRKRTRKKRARVSKESLEPLKSK